MKVYVEGKVYDCDRIPVAVVLDEKDRNLLRKAIAIASTPEHLTTFAEAPSDIPEEVFRRWLIETVPNPLQKLVTL